MPTGNQVIVASAGSTFFGVRDAADLYNRARQGACLFTVVTDHGHMLKERALSDTLDADMVLLPADMIDALAGAGKLLAGARTDLGTVAIGAAVRAGQGLPDVSEPTLLGAALANAQEILLTLAPSGEHLMQVIEALGLKQEIEARIRRFDKSTDVNAYLTRTQTRALAFGPATEILAWKDRGVQWCGPIPQTFQVALPYAGAILNRSANADTARTFLRFLQGDEARACFRDTGVVTGSG